MKLIVTQGGFIKGISFDKDSKQHVLEFTPNVSDARHFKNEAKASIFAKKTLKDQWFLVVNFSPNEEINVYQARKQFSYDNDFEFSISKTFDGHKLNLPWSVWPKTIGKFSLQQFLANNPEHFLTKEEAQTRVSQLNASVIETLKSLL